MKVGEGWDRAPNLAISEPPEQAQPGRWHMACFSLPRTCLEALKGLFWTNQYWEVFADIKLIQGWKLLENLETFPKGVTLLAR